MPFISSTDGDLKTAFVTNAWLIDQFVGNRLFVWGGNAFGQLGDNTITHRSSPVQTIALGVNWVAVSGGGGGAHKAAIKTDGTLWMWGFNGRGGLGNNTTTHRSSPVQTIAGGTNWSSLACGAFHIAAIKTDGTIWTWGRNNNGQLGDNTIIHRSSPIQTISFGTNWSKVSCGFVHTAAIKTDGSLWLWGINNSGGLGDNTTIHRSSPVQTTATGYIWKQVACGFDYTIAVTYGD